MRRILIILVLVSLSAFLVLGCGGSSSSSSNKYNNSGGNEDNNSDGNQRTKSNYAIVNTPRGVELLAGVESETIAYNSGSFSAIVDQAKLGDNHYVLTTAELFINNSLNKDLSNSSFAS